MTFELSEKQADLVVFGADSRTYGAPSRFIASVCSSAFTVIEKAPFILFPAASAAFFSTIEVQTGARQMGLMGMTALEKGESRQRAQSSEAATGYSRRRIQPDDQRLG